MKYRSEDDKCFGVAGMALGLVMFDASDLFTGVTIDADGLDCVQFTPEFFFCGDPRLDPKESWQTMVEHFQIGTGLVIANTMCRKMLLDHGVVDRKLRNKLFNSVVDEGKALCCLEKDEVEPIFNKYFAHMLKVFSNADICDAVQHLVAMLKEQRSFSNAEVSDLLHDMDIL